MERKELICIGCPLGCNLTVEMDGGQVVSVNGNTWNPEIAASQFLKRKAGCVMEHAP